MASVCSAPELKCNFINVMIMAYFLSPYFEGFSRLRYYVIGIFILKLASIFTGEKKSIGFNNKHFQVTERFPLLFNYTMEILIHNLIPSDTYFLQFNVFPYYFLFFPCMSLSHV